MIILHYHTPKPITSQLSLYLTELYLNSYRWILLSLRWTWPTVWLLDVGFTVPIRRSPKFSPNIWVPCETAKRDVTFKGVTGKPDMNEEMPGKRWKLQSLNSLYIYYKHFAGMLLLHVFFFWGGWILSNKNPHFFWISSQGSQEWLTDMNKLKVERGVGHPVWSSPPKRPPCVEAMLQYKEDPKLHQESPWQQYDQKPVAATFHQKKMGGNLKMSGLDVITSRWMAMKKGCKAKLADWLKLTMDLEIDQDALIDIQSLGIFISIYWHLHPWCMWNYIFDIILYR